MSNWRFRVSFIDGVGSETAASSALVVDATAGQTITLGLPVAPAGTATKEVYGSLENQTTCWFILGGASGTGGTGSVSAATTQITITLSDPGGVYVLSATRQAKDIETETGPIAGVKYIKFLRDRLYLARTSANPSRLFISNAGDVDTFPVEFQQDIGANDTQEITGLAVVSGELTIFRSKSIFLIPGDPEEVDPTQRIAEVGNIVENSIIEVEQRAWFISHRGVMIFDGFKVDKIDIPVGDRMEEFVGADRTASIYTERTLRWSMEDPDSAPNTIVMLYDLDNESWARYYYPSRPVSWFENLTDITIGTTNIPAGLYGVGGPVASGLRRYDYGTTDNGTTIQSYIRTSSVFPDDSYLEARPYCVTTDVTATVGDTEGIEARIDIGAGATDTVPGTIQAGSAGRRQIIKHPLTTDMYGRFIDVKVSWSGTLTLHRIFVEYQPSGRRSRSASETV